jgi:hypothetical protein
MRRMNSMHEQGETLTGKALSGMAFAAAKSAPTHSECSLLGTGGAANLPLHGASITMAVHDSPGRS